MVVALSRLNCAYRAFEAEHWIIYVWLIMNFDYLPPAKKGKLHGGKGLLHEIFLYTLTAVNCSVAYLIYKVHRLVSV
jgi:hypothetical protein